ncbi:hypothetical protein G6F42_027077 [Rhizopus arrhizus]|nr:hypothetical protein G6F42_027077 [Rhizopus arrhizus]
MSFGTIKATTAAEEGKSTATTTSAPSPFAGFGTPSKTTPSPFAGFGNPIPSARITEIHSPEGSDNEKDDSASSKPTEIVPAPKFSLTTTAAPAKETADKPPTISFGSFASTSTEKNSEESATVKKTEIPPTFAGLRSASEVSSPSSVIANAASPAPTVNTFESATSSTAVEKESTTTTTPATGEKKDSEAAEKEAASTSSLSGQQRRNSVTSTTSDTSTQATSLLPPLLRKRPRTPTNLH